jgi:hypothetical protein
MRDSQQAVLLPSGIVLPLRDCNLRADIDRRRMSLKFLQSPS